MPERLAEPDYPAEAAARTVRSNGEIKWRGDLIAVSTALVGEVVAVEETEDGQWLVRFYDTPIGLIDIVKKKLRRLAVPADQDGEAHDLDKPVAHLSGLFCHPSIRWTHGGSRGPCELRVSLVAIIGRRDPPPQPSPTRASVRTHSIRGRVKHIFCKHRLIVENHV